MTFDLTNEQYEDLCRLFFEMRIELRDAHVKAHGTSIHECNDETCLEGVRNRAVEAMMDVFGVRSTYECEHCKMTTPKCMWGPGWLTCPECGKQARTAAEKRGEQGRFLVQAQFGGVADGKPGVR